jgi:hypothetical protein
MHTSIRYSMLGVTSSRKCSSMVRSSTSTASRTRTQLLSTFQPPAPPGTKGTPIFPNIDFNVASSSPDSLLRNTDPDAVMVVTGSNRGIGLQFVKSLLHRTKVSAPRRYYYSRMIHTFLCYLFMSTDI